MYIITAMTSIDTATGKEAAPEISTERVYNVFSKIAKRYGRFNAVSSFGLYKKWLYRLVSMSEIDSNDIVLDIAGGTGDVSFEVAKIKHPKAIVCTDLVPAMLDVAKMREEAKPCGVPLTFSVADAQNLPFENESFNVVTMAYGLRNMPRREDALAEIFRVLKPGGHLACLDFSTPKNPIWNALYNVYLKYMIPFWGTVIAKDTEGFRYLSNSIKSFPNQEGVAKLMEDAGFTDVSWQDCSFGIAAVHIANKPL